MSPRQFVEHAKEQFAHDGGGGGRHSAFNVSKDGTAAAVSYTKARPWTAKDRRRRANKTARASRKANR